MLRQNAARVKNLTGVEIWLFIIARVLAGFGIGVLACRYLPQVAKPLGMPALVLGVVLFLVASRGLSRTTKEASD
jgi:hypothetical protein